MTTPKRTPEGVIILGTLAIAAAILVPAMALPFRCSPGGPGGWWCP